MAQEGRELLMGFDFGEKRIGVAFGNRVTSTAQGIAVVQESSEKGCFEKIEALVHEWQPQGFVVGVPFHPDGQPNRLTERCRRFARQLSGRFRLESFTVDERYTSVLLEGELDKSQIDMGSACLILEQYFQERS